MKVYQDMCIFFYVSLVFFSYFKYNVFYMDC